MFQQLSVNLSVSSSESREYTRSNSSLGMVAELVVHRTLERQTDTIKGLIMDDSFGGCGLVVATYNPPLIGQKCYLNIADLESLDVEVMWLQELDENVYRIGLKYNCYSVSSTKY